MGLALAVLAATQQEVAWREIIVGLAVPALGVISVLATNRVTRRTKSAEVAVAGHGVRVDEWDKLLGQAKDTIDRLEKRETQALEQSKAHQQAEAERSEELRSVQARLTRIERGLWEHQQWDHDVMRKARAAGIDIGPPPPILPLPA